MNRGKLLWFAAGAATSAVVTISAGLFESEPAPKVAFLILEEPSVEPPPPGAPVDRDDYSGTVASKTGEMLRDCKAARFETSGVGLDTSPYAMLPLTPDNAKSFTCVLENGTEQGFLMNIELRTDRNAQTH